MMMVMVVLMVMMMVEFLKDCDKYGIMITLQGIMMTKTKVEIALNHRSLFILTMISAATLLANVFLMKKMALMRSSTQKGNMKERENL